MLYFRPWQRRYILFRRVSIASRWDAYFTSQDAGHQLWAARVSARVPWEGWKRLPSRLRSSVLIEPPLAPVARVSTPSVKVKRFSNLIPLRVSWQRFGMAYNAITERLNITNWKNLSNKTPQCKAPTIVFTTPRNNRSLRRTWVHSPTD